MHDVNTSERTSVASVHSLKLVSHNNIYIYMRENLWIRRICFFIASLVESVALDIPKGENA